MAGLPGREEGRGQEEAPGEEPGQVSQPIHGKGHLVVVVRIALAEEAEDVLIDEVEVEETVDIAHGGVIADGVSLVGIVDAAKDVPGGGD